MDFRKLIEDGKYCKDNLKPKQKAFVNGIEFAKEVVENYKANYGNRCNIPIFEQMFDEIAENVLDGLLEYLDCDIAEAIVSFEDNNICEAEKE